MNTHSGINILRSKNLKVTPQRLIILEALMQLGNHPSSDMIMDYIKQKNPGIAMGTVYNVLDTLVDHGIIKRVKTEKGIMRYDSKPEKHHHLYSEENERIEDYFDPQLDDMIEEYFKGKDIPGFKIDDIKIEIRGKFTKE